MKTLPNLYNNAFVLSDGVITASLMIIGEAPGADEEKQGRPFVGKAGRLLNRLMKKNTYLKRAEIYVTNAVKQRPPENRKPTFREIQAHRYFLLQEIKMVKPKVILTLGKTALESLYNKEIGDSLAAFRLKKLKFGEATIIPTYHPAALFRVGTYLAPIINDLKKAESLLTKGAEV